MNTSCALRIFQNYRTLLEIHIFNINLVIDQFYPCPIIVVREKNTFFPDLMPFNKFVQHSHAFLCEIVNIA